MSKPNHINPVQWQQSLGFARQICAKMFREGGKPADAVRAYGVQSDITDWGKAVDMIAETLCTPANDFQRAA